MKWMLAVGAAVALFAAWSFFWGAMNDVDIADDFCRAKGGKVLLARNGVFCVKHEALIIGVYGRWEGK